MMRNLMREESFKTNRRETRKFGKRGGLGNEKAKLRPGKIVKVVNGVSLFN